MEIKTPFGYVIELGKTDEIGVAILVIEPGKEIEPEYHKKTKEVEYVINGDVFCMDKLFKKGAINVWEPEQVHGYKNRSNEKVKILCITIPPFDPCDAFKVQ